MPRPVPPARAARVLAELQARLEARRAEVAAEIRGYPPPIPACDQHYNHLLERRRGLLRALNALQTLREGGEADALRAALHSPAFESDPELHADLTHLLR